MDMKFVRQIFLICIFTATIFSYSAAQNNPNAKAIIINPKFVVTDIQFALQTLNTIELKGREVTAFMEVKSIFQKAIDKALTIKLKANDTLEVQMPILIGKNIMNLLERATLAGEHADNYLRFTSTLITEINKVESGVPRQK